MTALNLLKRAKPFVIKRYTKYYEAGQEWGLSALGKRREANAAADSNLK